MKKATDIFLSFVTFAAIVTVINYGFWMMNQASDLLFWTGTATVLTTLGISAKLIYKFINNFLKNKQNEQN